MFISAITIAGRKWESKCAREERVQWCAEERQCHSSGHRIWCWKKYVNRAKERKHHEGNWQGQPEGVRINNTCLKQRVPGALVPVDANSLSWIAV